MSRIRRSTTKYGRRARIELVLAFCTIGAVAGIGTVGVASGAYVNGEQLRHASTSQPRIFKGPQYQFQGPEELIGNSGNIWVENPGDEAVTGFNAATGANVKILTGSKFNIFGAYPIACWKKFVWVDAGISGGQLDQFNSSSGALLRVVKSKSDRLGDVSDMVVSGGDLWVASASTNAVTEFNAGSGAVIKVFTSQIGSPRAVAVAGGALWIWNLDSTSITELSIPSGKFVRTIKLHGHGGNAASGYPSSMIAVGSNLWIPMGNQIFVVALKSGVIESDLTAKSYSMNASTNIATNGVNIWLSNSVNNSLTEFSVVKPTSFRILKGSKYGFDNPFGVSLYDGYVWIVNSSGPSENDDGSITRLSQS
jgi:hypothetical protein